MESQTGTPPAPPGLPRSRDIVWGLLFAGLALFGPARTPPVIAALASLAVVQVLEPRFAWLASRPGASLSIGIKIALCFVLIGWTGGIASSYYWILLFPVLSSATALGPLGTALATLGCCAAFLSFLFFLRDRQFIPAAEFPELYLRVLVLPAVGYLAYSLAEANRVEAKRYRTAAAQLAEANASLREAEAAVGRSQRLAAIGQLSAGLAHELRNPLGTMKASAEMLARSVEAGNAVAREMAGYISSEVDRTNSLVTRFLDFARPMTPRLAVADLTEVLDRAVARLESHRPPFDAVVYRNYSPEVPPFAFDAELLERVFENLLLNAAQASPPRGAITVKTRAAGGVAEVSVIDAGAGIAPKNRESIFNPFFTTKPGGVGLGLAIVSKIVDEHGGSISVESEPGSGSVFRVLLPVAEGRS